MNDLFFFKNALPCFFSYFYQYIFSLQSNLVCL